MFMSYLGPDGVMQHKSLLLDFGPTRYPRPPPPPEPPLSSHSVPSKRENTAATMSEPHAGLVTALAK